VSNYDVNLHVAIASLRRIDATAPPTTSGTKPLDFFAGPGNKRCSECDSVIHAPALTFWMHAGVICKRIVRHRINFGSL